MKDAEKSIIFEFKFESIRFVKIKFKNLTENFTKFKPKIKHLTIKGPKSTTQKNF